MTGFAPMPYRLVTRRLTLESWIERDVSALSDLLRDRDSSTPGGAAAAGLGPVEAARSAVAANLTALRSGGIGQFTIRLGGEFLGSCGLKVGRASIEQPELTYELLRGCRGHGYATEAAQAVLDAARGTGRRRLRARVRTWNAASIRVLDRLGFERTPESIVDDFGRLRWYVRRLGPQEPGAATGSA